MRVTQEMETNTAVVGDKREMSPLMMTAVINFSVISDPLYPVGCVAAFALLKN